MTKSNTSFAVEFLEMLKQTINLNRKNLLTIEQVLKKENVTKQELEAVENIVSTMRQANTLIVQAIDNIIKNHYNKN